MTLGTVYWEETPERTREVTHVCRRCQERFGATITDVRDVWVVSPRGVGHIQHEDRFEYTLCGQNAIGNDWWWRL